MIKKECNICEWVGEDFTSIKNPRLLNLKLDICPNCKSNKRERLMYQYLTKNINSNNPLKVLHFAPEKSIEKLFKSYSNIDYLSVDINHKKFFRGQIMQIEDITELSFENDVFDIIFCSHVLEHIKDDAKAMSELYRVLKPKGIAIILIPLTKKYRTHKTHEDFSITDPLIRKELYGSVDHVRFYGNDFVDRLKNANFNVNEINDFKNILTQEEKEKLG